MNARTLVKIVSVGRMLFGAAMLVRPEDAVRGWIGERAASKGGTQAVTQAFGARDLVLGAGTLAALGSGDAKDWVFAGVFSDVVDLGATLTGEDLPLSGRVFVAVLAGGALAAGGAYLATGDDA